jgi:hypothetical protein
MFTPYWRLVSFHLPEFARRKYGGQSPLLVGVVKVSRRKFPIIHRLDDFRASKTTESNHPFNVRILALLNPIFEKIPYFPFVWVI